MTRKSVLSWFHCSFCGDTVLFGVVVLSFLYFFDFTTLMEKKRTFHMLWEIAAASCNDNKH